MATENGDSLVGRKEEGKEEEEVVVGKVQKLSTSEGAGPVDIDPELATKADEWKEIANIKFKGDLWAWLK